ncbi:MAG: hypothetical protein ACREM9_13680 [Gemmatimonadales bacterium]
MRHVPGTRALALAAGLLLAATGTAFAQDTTETGAAPMDTAAPEAGAIDTAGVDTAGMDTTGVDTAAVDTSATGDTTDTSGVQNPPGYRGMERDTTIFPDEGGPPATPGQVEDAATGTYEDSSWQDTTDAAQNPAGYRGMGDVTDSAHMGDSAHKGDSTTVGDTEPVEETSETPRLDPSESGGDTATQAVDSAQ